MQKHAKTQKNTKDLRANILQRFFGSGVGMQLERDLEAIMLRSIWNYAHNGLGGFWQLGKIASDVQRRR